MKRRFPAKGDFEREVVAHAEREFGGLRNFHIHGDRAYTRRNEFYSDAGLSVYDLDSLTLKEKQLLTWVLHKGRAFHPDCLTERMTRLIEESIRFGVSELHTTVDIVPEIGLRSLEVAEALRDKYKDKIAMKIWAYNPKGFKVRGVEEDRFELFEEAAKRADGIVALAEKDLRQGHIGDRQHNQYIATLSYKLKKPAQYHVGQENREGDRSVENWIEDLAFVQDEVFEEAPDKFPEQIAVHAISLSCKSREEFDRTADKMAERRTSLIVCSRAAISMLQQEQEKSYIHNSIAKAWHFALRGVPIKLGVDNLDDIYVPASSADIYDELEDFANALRGYHPRILAKILAGAKFDDFDKGRIRRAIPQIV